MSEKIRSWPPGGHSTLQLTHDAGARHFCATTFSRTRPLDHTSQSVSPYNHPCERASPKMGKIINLTTNEVTQTAATPEWHQPGLGRFLDPPSPPECARFSRAGPPSYPDLLPEPEGCPGANGLFFFSFWFTFFCFFSIAFRTAPFPPASARASYFARSSISFLSAVSRRFQ